MFQLETLVRVGGVLHLAMLIAGALLPRVVKLNESLSSLGKLVRQIIWVHGVFIVFVVVGFCAVSVLLPGELTSGGPLARSVCGFIAFFWFVRLLVQLFLFDAREYLTNVVLKLGYHGLTGVFTFLVVVYSAAAFVGLEKLS